MADIDRILRQALRDGAELAPGGEGLLAAVHERSHGLRRRRRATLAACAAVAVVAIGVPVIVAGDGGGGPDPAAPPGPTGSAGTGSWPSPSGSAPATTVPEQPSSAPEATSPAALRLTAAGYGQPTFPYRLAPSVAGDFSAPVVTLDRDALISFNEAKDPWAGADVTLVVTRARPAFEPAAGPVTEVARRVRGHAATLRTVSVRPAAQLTLYWQESAERWIQLRTDDTFTDTDVVGMAEGLTAAQVPVVAPFRVDLAPAGMVVGTQTPSALAFRPEQSAAGTPAAVSCTLVPARALAGATVAVGADRGTVTRDGSGVVLAVLLAEWHMTLLVEVPAAYPVSDADLVRFAAGLHVTERAEPAR